MTQSLGPLLSILGCLQDFLDNRQRVSVLVHQAFFMGEIGATPLTTPPSLLSSLPVTGVGGDIALNRYYFVKVTNVSKGRDICITHVWFDGDPPVHLLMPERSLPARLRPDEIWEGWVNAAALAHISNGERSGRVRLAGRTKTVRSRLDKDVPPRGYVASLRV